MGVYEVKQAIQSGEKIQIIDVRKREEYQVLHIPGALNIPIPDFKDKIIGFAKNFLFVTASGKGGGRSADAAQLIKEYGLLPACFR